MLEPRPSTRPLFGAANFRAFELCESDLPALQSFFDANPEYFNIVNGMPPRDDEARQEFDDKPPPEMPFDKRHLIGLLDDTGGLVGMANLLSDFLAGQVWHIGLFIVATALHGGGKASAMYRGLEHWIRSQGALWIRLGAVAGNQKAERFWEKQGYVEVRRRTGVQTGNHTSTVRVFVKALGAPGIAEYLRRVARDRPDAPLP